MAEENWIDRTLDRVKEMPVIGGAAAWVADRRETRRQVDAFEIFADTTISTHYRDRQLDGWRNALPPTQRETYDDINEVGQKDLFDKTASHHGAPPSDRDVSYAQYLDDVVSGVNSGTAWKGHEERMGGNAIEAWESSPPDVGVDKSRIDMFERDYTPAMQREDIRNIMEERPQSDRAWAADALDEAAHYRRAGDLTKAKEIVQVVHQEQRDAAKVVWDAPPSRHVQTEQSPQLRVNMQI